MKSLKSLFASNTEKNEVFITSDGTRFWDSSHAHAHAKGLKDTAVKAVSRVEAEAEETPEQALERIAERRKTMQEEIEAKYKQEAEELQAEEDAIRTKMEEKSSEEEESNNSQGGDNKPPEEKEKGTGAGAGTGSESGSTNPDENSSSTEGKGKPDGKGKSTKK